MDYDRTNKCQFKKKKSEQIIKINNNHQAGKKMLYRISFMHLRLQQSMFWNVIYFNLRNTKIKS